MNKIIITGNLVRDPDQRVTQQGINVCTFTVAVNRRHEQEADYFRVTTWREQAVSCAKYLKKGRKVAVVGSVSVSTYTGQTGETKSSLEIMAQEVEFLSPKETAENKIEYVEVSGEKLPF